MPTSECGHDPFQPGRVPADADRRMRIKYGLDVFTPTTQRGDDPWKPVMQNAVARLTFTDPLDMLRHLDAMQRSNTQLRFRAVEVVDDDPTYSL